MKIGDLLAIIFKYTGVKWLVEKIVIDLLGYKSQERQKKLNDIQINWEKKWKK